jgi:hypothetical protein
MMDDRLISERKDRETPKWIASALLHLAWWWATAREEKAHPARAIESAPAAAACIRMAGLGSDRGDPLSLPLPLCVYIY